MDLQSARGVASSTSPSPRARCCNWFSRINVIQFRAHIELVADPTSRASTPHELEYKLYTKRLSRFERAFGVSGVW